MHISTPEQPSNPVESSAARRLLHDLVELVLLFLLREIPAVRREVILLS